MLNQVFFLFLLKLKKTPLIVGVFAYFSYMIPLAVTGGFNDFIYNAGYIILFLIFLSVIFFAKMLKKIKTSQPTHNF